MKALPPPNVEHQSIFRDGPMAAFMLIVDPVVSEAVAKHRCWREFRPIARSAGLDPERGWAAVAHRRSLLRQDCPLHDPAGRSFGWCNIGMLQQILHRIDFAVGGGGIVEFDSARGILKDPDVKNRIKVRSLMEEAAESSIIEGAVVTRDVAREVLRTGRPAKDKHERMVVNNYRAMQMVKERLREPLSPRLLLDLQACLTDGTWEPGEENKRGRFRRADDVVVIEDTETREDIYTPPHAGLLPDRLKALCGFANTEYTGEGFIHPLLKACMLHFFVGYEHPFCDGNGRTARAVFFWSALRSGYGLFEYLVISELIRKARSQYPLAYLNTELDGLDLTYFLVFHLDIINRSVNQLQQHIRRESEQIERSARFIARNSTLNLRQRLLLDHALRHPTTTYTVAAHARSCDITPVTAKKDLDQLVSTGYLVSSKRLRPVLYNLSPKGLARLRKAADE